MAECKSPAHKAYREGRESVYIQAFIASRDLTKLVEQANAEAGIPGASREASGYFKPERLDEIVERIQFGQRQMAEAEAAINRHFDRGCKLVEKEVTQ